MQPACISASPPAAARPAGNATAADSASWQAALDEAQTPTAGNVPQAAAANEASEKPAAKPGAKHKDEATAVPATITGSKPSAARKLVAQPAAGDVAPAPLQHKEDSPSAAVTVAVAAAMPALAPPVVASAASPPNTSAKVAEAGTAATNPPAVGGVPIPAAAALVQAGQAAPATPSLPAPPVQSAGAAAGQAACQTSQAVPASGVSPPPQSALPALQNAAATPPDAGLPTTAQPTTILPSTALPSATASAPQAVAPPAGSATPAASSGTASPVPAGLAMNAGSKAGLAVRSAAAALPVAVKPAGSSSAGAANGPATSTTPLVSLVAPPAPAMPATTAAAQPGTAAPPPGIQLGIQPSAAGLAAAVTALHQSGQSGAVMQLDPPGLGQLTVHVALASGGQVNVLFVPSTQAASTALQANLNGLGTALAQTGLTLGQAQVGGQFNQNAGQNAYQPPARAAFPLPASGYEPETASPSGLSAYA